MILAFVLQPKQVFDLLYVVATTDPSVLKDVGIVPGLGDDGGEGVVLHRVGSGSVRSPLKIEMKSFEINSG